MFIIKIEEDSMVVIEVEVEVEIQLWDQVGGLSRGMIVKFLTSPVREELLLGQEFFLRPKLGGGSRVKEGFQEYTKIKVSEMQEEDLDAPSDFRIRDYVLAEVLFKTLGINVYLLSRKRWNEINSVTDLQIDLGLCTDCIGNSDVRNFYEIYSRKNVLSDIKLVPHLVGKMSNLNNSSLNQYLYLKHKRLVQMKHPSIAHEVEARLKVRVQQFRSSQKDKTHSFCLNRFGFIPNVEKLIEENMKLVLEQMTAA